MVDDNGLIFIHGLEGSSQGYKASLMREAFDEILIPDFRGTLQERMAQLEAYLLPGERLWTIVGSSFGGLMAAIFARQYPERVRKLILFAPALIWPDFTNRLPDPISIPTIIIHGSCDELFPPGLTRSLAEKVFLNLDFRVVDDDHGLGTTATDTDWHKLVES